MNRKLLIINIAMLCLILIGDVLYMTIGGLLIKGITSGLFVIVGLINLIWLISNKADNKKFSIFLLIGLVFAMLGDIVLNLNFIYGAILFALGHVFFFVAYCNLVKLTWKDLLYSAMIFVPAVLFILLAPMFNFGSVLMEIVCIVYAVIISCMVGKAVSMFVSNKNLLHIIIFIGSALFFVSDFMLLLNVFGNVAHWADIICLATYYPAEFLLAFSILVSSKENKNSAK